MHWELFSMMQVDKMIRLWVDLEMVKHNDISQTQLFKLLKTQVITIAGNQRLKIYGLLNCNSGKRMKKENRVFFKNETEAKLLGFRPCGHCMLVLYNDWKKRSIF